MGIAKKTDGRYVVGIGVTDANDYKGSAAYRDIFIQLTESGASDKSLDYLNYLKDYAIYHNSLGEPIMPPSVNVWISNHGVTTAVEADDLSLDGSNYTIGGIKWDGSAWDYSNAGQGSGGGSGSSLPSYSSSDIGKVLTVDVGEGQELSDENFIPSQELNFEDGGAALQEIMVDEETFQRVASARYDVDDSGIKELTPSTTPEGAFCLVSEDLKVTIGYSPRLGWFVVDETLSDGLHTISVSAILDDTPELAWKEVDAGIPVLPTNDGSYTLQILNGVASWKRLAD